MLRFAIVYALWDDMASRTKKTSGGKELMNEQGEETASASSDRPQIRRKAEKQREFDGVRARGGLGARVIRYDKATARENQLEYGVIGLESWTG